MQGYNTTVINPDPANASSYYFSQYGQVKKLMMTMMMMRMMNYSQYGQDAFLERFIFKERLKEGFFIEAGSANGVFDSNTLVITAKIYQ